MKGDDQAPLYKFLTEESTAKQFKGAIAWNFTKFVIDRNGNITADSPARPRPAIQRW